MSTYRQQLGNVYQTLTQSSNNSFATHAGLWLDKYIEKQDRESVDSRSGLIKYATTLPMPEAYRTFYQRWEKILKAEENKVQTRKATVKGRMIVGLGDESVLETSIALHHTYGMPYIPGSALKGLAASYARQKLTEKEWQVKGEVYGEAYKVVFGDTSDAGYITFLDAFYIPDSGHQKRALYPDVITVHHKDYYQDKDNAPADWDSPTPIPFMSATGSYLIALVAPDLEQSTIWLTKTFEILEHALKEMGIGAKTSSGYGRMVIEPPPVDPDMQKVEMYIKEINRLSLSNVASQMPTYQQKWQQLVSDEARFALAKAIMDKVHEAGRDKASAGRAWYEQLKAFLEKV